MLRPIVHGTFTFFGDPTPNSSTLSELPVYLAIDNICAREMTKRHQQFIRGFASILSANAVSKGEFTLVVGPAKKTRAETVPVQIARSSMNLAHGRCWWGRAEGGDLTVARKFGLSAKDVYAIIER